jgi:hypothetical protein
MINTSRLALIAVATVSIASPALAQSFDGNAAMSTVQQHRVAIHNVRRHAVAPRQNGFNAFAMVPGSADGSALSPAATGGGSLGYNENLRRDQW